VILKSLRYSTLPLMLLLLTSAGIKSSSAAGVGGRQTVQPVLHEIIGGEPDPGPPSPSALHFM